MPERRPDHELVETVSRAVHARLTRFALAVLVIVSLLPGLQHNAALNASFLVVFGAELAARAYLWRKGKARRDKASYVLGAFDVLAFLSFVPVDPLLPHDDQGVVLAAWAQVLNFFRLTRLLILLRFARDLARDIYTIMTRRELLQQFALVTGAVLFLSFVAAVVLSTLGIDYDYDGQSGADKGFIDALWWSFRQLESADNLVPSARLQPLLTIISLALTVTGVFIISFIIGIGANVVDQVVRAERRRPIPFRGHSIVVGPVEDAELLVRELVRIYAKNRNVLRPERLVSWLLSSAGPLKRNGIPQVALLGGKEEMPAFLYDPLMRWAAYRAGDSADPSDLTRVAAKDAKRAILLAHPEAGHEADAVTVATLAAFRAMNPHAHAFVELKERESCAIVRSVGGKGTVALDVPRFLGLFLCQHLVTRGVEHLYRDLLTADGSEFYTHLFVEPEEARGLAAAATAQGSLSFDEMSRRALAEHGVLLCGVFLGETPIGRGPGGVIPVDGLVHWMNPHQVPDDDPRVAALGGRPGLVPISTLRGLVGICESYTPLRAYAEQLLAGRGTAAPDVDDAALRVGRAVAARARLDEEGPRRVLLVGFSEALPALVDELSRFVPGVDATLVLSEREGEHLQLRSKLAALGIALSPDEAPPGLEGREVALARGGRVTIHTHEGPDLSKFATRVLQRKEPVQAVVFLNEPEAGDRDARVALRVLRFVRHLEAGTVPKGEHLHLIAEFQSVEKGAYIQQHVDVRKCGFVSEDRLKLTLVSMEQIKNYFLVHSAFVPGVVQVYDELLQERGQEIVRLEVPAGMTGEVSLEALRAALASKPCIPIALDAEDGVRLLPSGDEPIRLGSVRGVYAVADAARLGREEIIPTEAAADPVVARA